MPQAGQPRAINCSWTRLVRPAEAVRKLSRACQAILAGPEPVTRWATTINETTPDTLERAASCIAAEVAHWADVVKQGNT